MVGPVQRAATPAFFIGMWKVTVNLSGLNRLRKRLLDNPRAMSEIRQAWSTIYRAFVRLRFVRASRGDGTWPPLAISTVRRRRNHSDVILRDTGKLLASFQPTLGNAGSIAGMDKPLGIEMGLGSTGLGLIARYHQEGSRTRPPRELLVVPPQSEITKMKKAAVEILGKHGREGN